MNKLIHTLLMVGSLSPLLFAWAAITPPAAKAQMMDSANEVVKIPINTERSIIVWKGTEMWQSGKHEGTVNLRQGYLLLKDRQLLGGQFIADMNSIAITDIPKHEKIPRRRLRNHLKSDDFFYVQKYPTADFEISNTETFTADSLKVWGDLSIRDITKEIEFTAYQRYESNNKQEFWATFKIDRFEWNISYQGSYWKRITSIIDNTLVDADIYLTVHLVAHVTELNAKPGN